MTELAKEETRKRTENPAGLNKTEEIFQNDEGMLSGGSGALKLCRASQSLLYSSKERDGIVRVIFDCKNCPKDSSAEWILRQPRVSVRSVHLCVSPPFFGR